MPTECLTRLYRQLKAMGDATPYARVHCAFLRNGLESKSVTIALSDTPGGVIVAFQPNGESVFVETTKSLRCVFSELECAYKFGGFGMRVKSHFLPNDVSIHISL